MSDSPMTCFAQGRDGQWEAICLDRDIAVAGRSLSEVRELLQQAVSTYVLDVDCEAPWLREGLLSRRCPLPVRLSFEARAVFAPMIERVFKDRRHARFTIPCPD
jgi:hypothetical protein